MSEIASVTGNNRVQSPVEIAKRFLPVLLGEIDEIVRKRSPPYQKWGGASGDRLGNGRSRVALTTRCDHLGDVRPRQNVPLTAGVDDAGQ